MQIFFVIHSEKDLKNNLNSLNTQNYQNYSIMTREISRYSLLIKVNDSGRKMKVDGSGRPISFMVYLGA